MTLDIYTSMPNHNGFVWDALRHSGWFHGRNVATRLQLPQEFEASDVALRTLNEFGLLSVARAARGIDVAPSNVTLDPMKAFGERDRFDSFLYLTKEHLYPIGEIDAGHFYFAIAPSGKTFAVMDMIILLGENFLEGLDNLISGRNMK